MEPENQHPETGAARVRSDPSCAGQARGRAGPNILIDVRPTLAGTPYLRQETKQSKIIRELSRNKYNEVLFSCKYIHVLKFV